MVQVHDDGHAAAAQADHRRCLVVGLRNVRVKVACSIVRNNLHLVVRLNQVLVGGYITLSLDQLTKDKVAKYGGKELADVHTLREYLSQHPRGS